MPIDKCEWFRIIFFELSHCQSDKKVWNSDMRPKKVKKHTITQISRKRYIGQKNATVSFLCGSSRAIQQFLIQVATTISFRVMTENVDSVRVRKTQNCKYLENGAPYEEKYAAFLCGSSRGIQWSLFQVDTTNTFWVKTRHMEGKPFTSCTFWSLFGVNRPSSFRDMADQSFWPFDLYIP